MVITDLLIKASNGTDSFKYYPIAKNIPINLTFALADVREPDKRKASFSKTIELYGTNEINKLFENIFSFNVATQYFNKNLKSPCKYIVDGIENFSGDLQLLKVNIKADKSIVYECSIIGDSGSIFVDIGDKLITGNADSLEDLDFSAYDHTYDRATQIATRANLGTGTDVLYPFVDKGRNGGSDTIWNVKDFLPCFSLYEYIKKIIEDTGRTFTSTFLESSFFKHLIVYPNIDKIPVTSTQLNDSQWYAGANYGTGATVLTTLATTTEYVFTLNDTTSTPFFDLGSQLSSYVITLNESGKYNVIARHYLDYEYTHSDPNVVNSLVTALGIESRIQASTDGGSTWITIASQYNQWKGQSVNNFPTDRYFDQSVATGEIELAAGTKLRTTAIRLFPFTAKYYNIFGGQITTGSSSIGIYYETYGGSGVGLEGTTFYGLITDKSVFEGQTLFANKALPLKIKQKDLLKSTMMAFNLFVEPNPNDPNDLIIEPFDEFYNTLDVVDFGNRTDLDKDQTVNPNILEGKRYIYSYKEDVDHYNTLYKTSYNETFGTEQIDVENDFIKADKKTELIFSATPNVANYGLNIAHPRIYKIENSTIKPYAQNIRLLYCSGVKNCNLLTYTEFGQSDLITTEYLYAGHTDDAFNPTLDLNFGLPKEVYYNFINAYFTDNNLYNAYHKQYLTNLIDRDGKFVTKYLWLSPKDIYNFSFRNRIFVDGAYYIVNKIENYNPIEQDSTKCELIKLLDTPVFTPTSYRLSDSTINTGANIQTAKLNNALNVGNGIQNKGTNCVAIGDNIIIPESCSGVTIIGNNIVVDENTTDLTIINNAVVPTITAPYATIKTVTANYNAKYYDGVIFADATSASLTIDLSISELSLIENNISVMGLSFSMTKTITIKKIDSSVNTIIIDGSGALIDGFATFTIYTQYDSVTLQWDGTNWNKI